MEEEGMKMIEVAAAVIENSGKYFADQRGRGEWKDWWEFPGGKIEPGESPEEALKREIREELDTEISIDRFLMTIDYDYPAFHLRMHCYLCRLSGSGPKLLEAEDSRWLSPSDLLSVRWLPADAKLIESLSESKGGYLQMSV
jgi:8-oxo-dGTP diphosphatase